MVFGATGYTGELTVRSLLLRGVRPLLAARDPDRLARLAASLGDLEHRVATVDRPETVAGLVDRADVLISTVGPFLRWGQPALAAAVAAGAHYLDSTGEPGFIRQVFERWGPQAQAKKCALITAMGYDYVPGNLAGALALQDAGEEATSVEIGYFTTGASGLGSLSGGTRASMAGTLAEPSFAWRDGRLQTERGARRWRPFTIDNRGRSGVSVGGSEHLALPTAFPHVKDVGVFLGWFGLASPAVAAGSAISSVVTMVPGVRRLLRSGLGAVVHGSTGGPDAEVRARVGTLVVAEARDAQGRVLSRSRLEGPNPYAFTADILAWAAIEASEGGLRGTGALGPVSAFGTDALVAGAETAGLVRTG